MNITELTNNAAKKVIRPLIKTIDDYFHRQLVLQWLDESNTVKVLLISKNKIIRSFALLHKCDHDPLNGHVDPYVLDFIYTFHAHRCNKFALKLITYAKQHAQITAFCSSDIACSLFQSAGYNLTRYDEMPIPMYRYP